MEGKLSSQPPTHSKLSTKHKIYGLHQGGGLVCTLFEDRFVGKEVGLSIEFRQSVLSRIRALLYEAA
jgi:hypothetical protein